MKGLRNKKRHSEPTNCKECGVELTSENIKKVKSYGIYKTGLRCKVCSNKQTNKYNQKRYKAIKDSKWF